MDEFNIKEAIINFLKENPKGLSITDIVKLLGMSRSAIRTALAVLEGAQKVAIRQTGMTKLYYLFEEETKIERN